MDVVGDIRQVLREAQECADLVEGANDLRSLTSSTLLDHDQRNLLEFAPYRLTRHWGQASRHPEDLEGQIVEQIVRGGRRLWRPLGTRRDGRRRLRDHLLHRTT